MSWINQYNNNQWDYLSCSNFDEEYTVRVVQVKTYSGGKQAVMKITLISFNL